MNAIEVKPKDWLMDPAYPIRVLYDDGDYSVIWGKYRGVEALGVRWNQGDSGNFDRGYPGQGVHPTWYIEPDFLAAGILQRLINHAHDTNNQQYLDNIHFAMEKLNNKIKTDLK